MSPHELHDTDLVIDGDNLASILMKNLQSHNSAFGGDYDAYYEYVRRFFAMLKRCNVHCYVLLDGGYQPAKLKTVKSRLNQKICAIKNINPINPSHSYFPLLFREVFIQAMQDSGVQYMRCLFEADHELAVLAKHLQCPVLSYDSDFYIYNVLYIPSVTLTFKVYKKVVHPETGEQVFTERLTLKGRKRQKKNLRPYLDLDADDFDLDDVDEDGGQCYYFLDCSIYEMKNLNKVDQIDPDIIPFLPAILGNDQITFFKLNDFVQKFNRQKNKKRKKHTQFITPNQRRVENVITGLKNESFESVQSKLSTTLGTRQKFMEKMSDVADSYQITDGQYGTCFKHFGLATYVDDEDESVDSDIDDDDEDEDEEELEGDDDDDGNSEIIEEEHGTENSEADAIDDLADNQKDDLAELDNLLSGLEITETPVKVNNPEKKKFLEHPQDIEPWFVEKFVTGVLPRFCMDMVNLKIYINSPQIENFQMEDANIVSQRIIVLILSMLHKGRDDVELYYLTRKPNTRLLSYKVIKSQNLQRAFDPYEERNMDFIRDLFQPFQTRNRIFDHLPFGPEDCQLYFLSIAYWSKYSRLFDATYVRSLIICYITLSIVDKKCGIIRSEREFDRTFEKDLERIKAELTRQRAKQKPLKLSPYFAATSERLLKKKVTKQEAVVALERLVPFLSKNTLHHKKHQSFSTKILHGFAQFQSVVCHLRTVNALCNHPLRDVQMERLFKGFYLYNLYCNLQKRNDADYYIRNTLFKGANNLWNYYEYLSKWTAELVESKRC